MPIWSKLGLIMIVPTIATVLVGARGIVNHVEEAGTAGGARSLARLAESSGALVHGLQNERAAAVLLLGYADGAQKQKYADAYVAVHSGVDEAIRPYSQRRGELGKLPDNVVALLNEIDKELADLGGIRSQVSNAQIRLSDAIRGYDVLVNNLLGVRDSAIALAGDFGLSERMRAAEAVARSKEYLSQKRIVVHRAIIQGALTTTLRTEFIAAEQGQNQAAQIFSSVATPAEIELHSQTVSGSDLRSSGSYSDWVRTKPAESMQFAPFSADDWDAALVKHANLIRTVEAELDSGVVKRATDLRDQVRQQMLIESGVLVAMLLLAILFAWLVARSMARSLRELRQGALSVAQHGLPQAVARLRDPQFTGQLSPTQVANQIAEPLPVRSRDEFGQVTEAFNKVHLEAVRTAAEQAALRSSVSTMFINLARRSQILVDRLIGHLDRIERGEEDPDRLAELFQLDHLATRMRRNDENLLVLAGADSTRVQREAAALLDVLRAAQSEVEHYTRVEFGMIDRDIEIAAHGVNDMVHLVAELLDNATAFSPPDSPVVVEARRVGDRAVLYVEDRGIGMSAEQLAELNERLATPPMVDVAVSRMMGLVVVARLASRHGVKVELRPAANRGTVAEVMMPASVLVPRPGSPALPAGGEAADRQPSPVPEPRPQFSAPPAAEGRMAGAPAAFGLGVGSGNRPLDAGPVNGQGSRVPATAGQALPQWSDLTGATPAGASPSGVGPAPFAPQPINRSQADPLPQRRASEHWPADSEAPASGPAIPRQLSSSPESQPYGVSRTSAVPSQPAPVTPPVATPSISAPPVSAPPAWPPVPAEQTTAVSAAAQQRPATTDLTTELPAASLDMTTELPRVTQPTSSLPEPAVVPAPAVVPTPRPADVRPPYADETMELPIFREVESAWFRTRRKVPEEVADAQPSTSAGSATAALPVRNDLSRSMPSNSEGARSTGTTGKAAMMDTSTPAGLTQGSGSGAAAGSTGAGGPDTPWSSWRTAADDGWRAASAAAEAAPSETTRAGLPKRVPMAQLVPGGVDNPTTSTQRRTPEAVRGLLSAYHRGVQRGRGTAKDDHRGTTPGGQQSTQSGYGTTAGSGQKEH